MIPIIEEELRKRGWVDADEIDDVVVLAQSAPGLWPYSADIRSEA